MPASRECDRDHAATHRWLVLAVSSLLGAGLLALLLVVARMPPLDRLVSDPLFFKRCLVVHVDLSLVVFFHAFAAALFAEVPSARPPGLWARGGPAIALAGVAAMVLAAGMPGAEPVLSNYVPMIEHPVFMAGISLVGLGLAGAFLGGALRPSAEAAGTASSPPHAARVLLRGGAVAFLIALVTFAAGLSVTPRDLPSAAYWEVVAWGGGHELQTAAVAGMLGGWVMLVDGATGRCPLGRGAASVLAALLVAPLCAGPLLAFAGTTTPTYLRGFTLMMQWGIFPVVGIVLALCCRTLWRHGRAVLPSPGVIAFGASAALTLAGFALGASIRGSNTVVPAHYHASIGAISVVYMALSYRLLQALGRPVPDGWRRRAAAWQPALSGAGQMVLALGFALAGSQGMARKVYGAEQAARSALETVGLATMGAGGLVAVGAGGLYLWLVGSALIGRPASSAEPRSAAAAAARLQCNPGGTT